MNAGGGTGNLTRNGDQLSPDDDCDSLKCKWNQMDEECKSGASISLSEETCDGQENKPSNRIYVKDSSDIHIGDRTYFTIHQTTSSSGDDLKKIISQVVESPNIKTVVDVKTSDQPGYSSGVFVQGFKLVKEGSSNAANGTTLAILDSQHSNSSNNKSAVNCKPLANHGAVVIAVLVSVLVAAGVTFAAVYLSLSHQSTVAGATESSNGEYYRLEFTDRWILNELRTSGTYYCPVEGIERPDVRSQRFLFGKVSTPNGVRYRFKNSSLVSRDDWGSWRPLAHTAPLGHPIHLVIVAHTAGRSCETPVECGARMRDLQDYSVGHLNHPDIPYNFLVGRDGNAYEGVGWDVASTFSKNYFNCSISIAYVGNYVHLNTTPQQLQATRNILDLGVELKKLTPDYLLVAHNLTTNVLSPGIFVYQQIKTLPHFTAETRALPDCDLPPLVA